MRKKEKKRKKVEAENFFYQFNSIQFFSFDFLSNFEKKKKWNFLKKNQAKVK